MICCFNWLARAALVFAVSNTVAGCAATTGVSDELDLDALQKKSAGVAVMYMRHDRVHCLSGSVVIGRKATYGYDVVNTLTMANNLIDRGVPPQIELAPGRYHLLAWKCQGAGPVYIFGEGHNRYLPPKNYPKSYATFTVKSGEVVNVGMLRMKKIGLNKVSLSVTDLPEELKAGLKKERPKLYARMTTRLMKRRLSTKKYKPLSELTDEQLAARCRQLKAMSARLPGEKADLNCD